MHRHKPTRCVRKLPLALPFSSADLNVQSETLSASRPFVNCTDTQQARSGSPPPRPPRAPQRHKSLPGSRRPALKNTARPKRGAEDAARAPERRERSKFRARARVKLDGDELAWGKGEASAPLFFRRPSPPLTSAAGHSAFGSLRRVTRLVATIFPACAAGSDCSGSLPGGIAFPKEVRPKTSCPASAQHLGRDGLRAVGG